MNEITASGKSPLTNYIENVLIELDGIDAARRGIFHEEGVNGLSGLLSRYGNCHQQWFRLAMQEMREDNATTKERELLQHSMEKHTECLRTARAYIDGDVTRDVRDDAYAESMDAVGQLVYLSKPAGTKAKLEMMATDIKNKSSDNADKTDLLISTITAWHKYEFDKCENYEPIKVSELAKKSGASKSTCSKFFKKQFGGLPAYKAMCRAKTLSSTLGPLNKETPARIKTHEAQLDWQS